MDELITFFDAIYEEMHNEHLENWKTMMLVEENDGLLDQESTARLLDSHQKVISTIQLLGEVLRDHLIKIEEAKK